jgi:hypothetical protein
MYSVGWSNGLFSVKCLELPAALQAAGYWSTCFNRWGLTWSYVGLTLLIVDRPKLCVLRAKRFPIVSLRQWEAVFDFTADKFDCCCCAVRFNQNSRKCGVLGTVVFKLVFECVLFNRFYFVFVFMSSSCFVALFLVCTRVYHLQIQLRENLHYGCYFMYC